MRGLSQLERWAFPATPATRLAALRILVGLFSTVYLLVRGVYLTSYGSAAPSAFEPVGVARLLSGPLPSPVVIILYFACLGASVCATLGVRYRISGPVWGLGLLALLSYRNSWGMIFHTENLLVLYALALMFAPAADSWSLTARNKPVPPASDRYAWPITTMNWLLVLTYVLAGVAKLKAVGFEWLDGEQLRSHIAFDALRKIELGSFHSPLGVFLVRHPEWLVPFSALSLGLEVMAPLALIGRRAALVWTAGVWLFHAGVLLTMAIVFPFPLLGIAFAPLFRTERLLERWVLPALDRWRKRAPGSTTDA
jgi:Vitamin K-dependent gamma-carboxylase